MTVTSARIAPPYSIVAVNDPANETVPEWVDDSVLMATDSCIVIACKAEVDGETEFTLGNTREVDPGDHPIFQEELKTPSRRIVVETAEGDTILETPTSQPKTKVQIWTNSSKRPGKIIIGID